jgi:hypothetical protein
MLILQHTVGNAVTAELVKQHGAGRAASVGGVPVQRMPDGPPPPVPPKNRSLKADPGYTMVGQESLTIYRADALPPEKLKGGTLRSHAAASLRTVLDSFLEAPAEYATAHQRSTNTALVSAALDPECGGFAMGATSTRSVSKAGTGSTPTIPGIR